MLDYIIEKVDSVDSTNDYLIRELQNKNLRINKVLIAKHQTNGHGSNGRSFVSDKDVGIYFTFLYHYKELKELSYITQKASVAVYNVFKELFNVELAIKWINDLYYNNKKVCGILCKNLILYNVVLIGIGIDLFKNLNIDDSIKDIAGYIFENQNELIRACTIDIKEWDTEIIVKPIIDNILKLINYVGLPKTYIDKNLLKDERIYEDCVLEC